jgi:Flp pilus assembly protein TadD
LIVSSACHQVSNGAPATAVSCEVALAALAWAQNANGDAEKAWKTMQSALSLGTADARLYLRAAAISAQAGQTARAKIYAGKASKFALSLLPDERIWLKLLLR